MDRVTTNYQFTFPVSDDFIEKVPPIFSDIAFFILENMRRAPMMISVSNLRALRLWKLKNQFDNLALL